MISIELNKIGLGWIRLDLVGYHWMDIWATRLLELHISPQLSLLCSALLFCISFWLVVVIRSCSIGYGRVAM